MLVMTGLYNKIIDAALATLITIWKRVSALWLPPPSNKRLSIVTPYDTRPSAVHLYSR
jgi:hypothetical protein